MYMQVDVPMERPPVANWVLIAANFLVSVLLLVAENKARHRLDLDALSVDPEVERQLNDPRVPEATKRQLVRQEQQRIRQEAEVQFGGGLDHSPRLKYALHADRDNFHVWQLITYQFVHADIVHLLGNMLFLFCFGNAINAKLGHVLFVAVYLGLGVMAGLSYAVVSDGRPLIGASGAIAGITGVFLVLYPINEIAVWTVRSFLHTGDAWRFPSWVFIVFYMAWDLFGTMKLTGDSGVAYVCHLGGELVGIGVACGLVAAGWVRSNRGEQNLLELWGWVDEPRPRRRKRRRPKPPPPRSDIEL